MKTNFKIIGSTVVLFVTFGLLTGCSNPSTAELQKQIDALTLELETYQAAEALTEQRLIAFDSLDYDFYTNQKWDQFSHSHADDIVVYNADGSITKGLYPAHINDLQPMFVFAPDTRIENHPVKFGNGNWTAVIDELQGTFTEPMPIGDETTIPPTGKAFKLRMATIAHWENNKMTEEYLFYDNQDFMRQIGLAQ